jgi:outer membrane immunogenic protein
MAVKAPPPPPAPVWSWTGFYIGADAGYAWNDGTGGRTCINPAGAPFGAGCTQNIQNSVLSQRGGLVGGEAGYNIQFGNLLAGVETDLQWSNVKDSAVVNLGVPTPTCCYLASANMDWFGTTRFRFGFLPTERLLLYITAGAIWGHESVSAVTHFTGGSIYPASGSTVHGGAIVGAGLEYAFLGNLSAKVEGLVYDMGAINPAFACPTGATTCTPGFTEGGTFALRGVMVRGGLNWHFGGPVVANY